MSKTQELILYWIENSESYEEFKYQMEFNGIMAGYKEMWNEYWSKYNN